jgi:DNA-binding NarL/FixJ family response regulator
MLRQRSIAVILIGKSILLREGLAKILRAANFRIVASVSNADDLCPSKAILHVPLYLIVHTGDDFDIALEQIALFRNRHPNARIAIVADHCRLNELTLAYRAGAHGYFVSGITCDRFIRSIELVMMGETIFPSECLSFAINANRPCLIEAAASDRNGERIAFPTEDATAPLLSPREVKAAASDRNGEKIAFPAEDATAPLLSPREKVILRCITEGASNKWIARKIDIAEATVKVHVKAILRKIRVQNRTQAAVWGFNNGSHTQPEGDGCLSLPSPPDAKIASSIPMGRLRKG